LEGESSNLLHVAAAAALTRGYFIPMCGLAGILRIHASGAYIPAPEVAIPDAWLGILDESIRYRGRDGQGRFRDRTVRADGLTVDVALIHRRLAIIDPAGGGQPMVSEQRAHSGGGAIAPSERRRIAAVFNGCLYNHRELRRSLEDAGHRFRSDHSDTEVWLHGWRKQGAEFWRQLRDWMGAIAIWDSREATLFIGRDRFGEKPLYMLDTTDGPVWAFASTAGALARLLAELGGERTVDPLGLGDWIRYGADPDLTPLRRIVQLPAACGAFLPQAEAGDRRLLLHLDQLELAPDDADVAHLHGQPLADRIEGLLNTAVEQRLDADVPLGCFLSGGVDSSLVAIAARRSIGDLSTICVRMPDPRYDESQHAERIAAIIGSRHTTVDADPQPASDLVRLIETLGLPFGDSSLLPTWWAASAAARHLRVVLTGDGADELFLGYDRHIAMRLLPFARPAGAVLGRRAVLPRGHPKSRRERMARFLTAARHEGYADLVAIFPTPDWQALVHVDGRELLTSSARARSVMEARDVDVARHLPADMLRKVDTATMAAGVEARAPFLAPAVAGAALALSRQQLMPFGQRKGLLRMIARKHFPSASIDRPKMGFAIPIGEWFRTDYGGMKQLLLDHLQSSEPWGPPSLGIELNMKCVRRMLEEHMSGRRDHDQRLYMLLVLSIWARSLPR
jgi:asparagine synthase (glutamine-hydrolysing)